MKSPPHQWADSLHFPLLVATFSEYTFTTSSLDHQMSRSLRSTSKLPDEIAMIRTGSEVYSRAPNIRLRISSTLSLFSLPFLKSYLYAFNLLSERMETATHAHESCSIPTIVLLKFFLLNTCIVCNPRSSHRREHAGRRPLKMPLFSTHGLFDVSGDPTTCRNFFLNLETLTPNGRSRSHFRPSLSFVTPGTFSFCSPIPIERW